MKRERIKRDDRQQQPRELRVRDEDLARIAEISLREVGVLAGVRMDEAEEADRRGIPPLPQKLSEADVVRLVRSARAIARPVEVDVPNNAVASTSTEQHAHLGRLGADRCLDL